jgi:hypothetical protein
VWNGVSINPRFRSVADIAAAVLALVPACSWDQIEWLVKAGEGGSYQASWLHPSWGDGHPLAVDGAAKLGQLIQEGQQAGIRVTPYVVIRRGTMAGAEQAMIRELVHVAGRCVLNREPGPMYDAGPFDPADDAAYLAGIGCAAACLEVCTIPRIGQVQELGGAASIRAWSDGCGSASWETYGLVAPIPGPTSLRVDQAIPRVSAYGWAGSGQQYRIPVVQRGELGQWAWTAWADAGLQCWHLDGDI